MFLASGLLLFVLGIVGLVHPDFTYHKTEEVARIGPVHATVNEERVTTVPTFVSVASLVLGLGFTVVGVRRRA